MTYEKMYSSKVIRINELLGATRVAMAQGMTTDRRRDIKLFTDRFFSQLQDEASNEANVVGIYPCYYKDQATGSLLIWVDR